MSLPRDYPEAVKGTAQLAEFYALSPLSNSTLLNITEVAMAIVQHFNQFDVEYNTKKERLGVFIKRQHQHTLFYDCCLLGSLDSRDAAYYCQGTLSAGRTEDVGVAQGPLEDRN